MEPDDTPLVWKEPINGQTTFFSEQVYADLVGPELSVKDRIVEMMATVGYSSLADLIAFQQRVFDTEKLAPLSLADGSRGGLGGQSSLDAAGDATEEVLAVPGVLACAPLSGCALGSVGSVGASRNTDWPVDNVHSGSGVGLVPGRVTVSCDLDVPLSVASHGVSPVQNAKLAQSVEMEAPHSGGGAGDGAGHFCDVSRLSSLHRDGGMSVSRFQRSEDGDLAYERLKVDSEAMLHPGSTVSRRQAGGAMWSDVLNRGGGPAHRSGAQTTLTGGVPGGGDTIHANRSEMHPGKGKGDGRAECNPQSQTRRHSQCSGQRSADGQLMKGVALKPGRSALTHAQHRRYLSLFASHTKRFFSGSNPLPPSGWGLKDVEEFEELQKAVCKEQEVCQTYLRQVSCKNSSLYFGMSPDAVRYCEQRKEDALRRAQSYNRYYADYGCVPLDATPPSTPADQTSLVFVRTLLELGSGCGLNVPPTAHSVGARQTVVVPTDLQTVSTRFPAIRGELTFGEDGWNHQPPSKDSNLTLLVRKHRCDVAVSASVLLTLILSHFSDTQCAWDIPVIVKELPGESASRTVVFMDKPIHLADLDNFQKKKLYQRKALRAFICRPCRGLRSSSVRPSKMDAVDCPVLEQASKFEDDPFGEVSMDDLETFGCFGSPSRSNKLASGKQTLVCQGHVARVNQVADFTTDKSEEPKVRIPAVADMHVSLTTYAHPLSTEVTKRVVGDACGEGEENGVCSRLTKEQVFARSSSSHVDSDSDDGTLHITLSGGEPSPVKSDVRSSGRGPSGEQTSPAAVLEALKVEPNSIQIPQWVTRSMAQKRRPPGEEANLCGSLVMDPQGDQHVKIRRKQESLLKPQHSDCITGLVLGAPRAQRLQGLHGVAGFGSQEASHEPVHKEASHHGLVGKEQVVGDAQLLVESGSDGKVATGKVSCAPLDSILKSMSSTCDVFSRNPQARVNMQNDQVLTVEEVSQIQSLRSVSNFSPQQVFAVLEKVFQKLVMLPPGGYLLHHDSGVDCLQLRMSSTCKRGVYDLYRQQNWNSPTEGKQRDSVPWVPVDPALISPYHSRQGIIPVTFLPKDYRQSQNRSQRQQRPRGGKSRKKWKKRKQC